MEADESLAALMPLIYVLVFLITASIFWCFLSSCMGLSLRQFGANLWEYCVLSSRTAAGGPQSMRRRNHAFGEEELWEMEYRGRGG
ncbi:uncharacterized protein EV420DRAFT_811848 [Desarmillaria tabescens]|uniref:Uncharacterized protein n=1 Tax=Armillaria tabescens TaxID=1929756 RepID=A0AA39T5M4_ARMTA|nr:uncharacterized protein EV420DRAFT_811848 [Desarmillaria tabescens]KAK0466151.1 hypothetical protein EV420DRAFT_811848 [Desarmillaria tabescens]